MGKEISKSKFSQRDFERFHVRLLEEMEHLRQLFTKNRFASGHEVGGFELEAWLIGRDMQPAAINHEFISRLNNPLVVHELSRFNVELNSPPHELKNKALSRMQMDLEQLWQTCNDTAATMDARLMMTGTLPVLDDSALVMENMSEVERYRALNEQVLKLRQGRPIVLDIRGRERLQSIHHDVMLEAAATSFQVHLQIPLKGSVRYYNASVLSSLPLLAAAANSPFVFGKELWDETRIPLFEQSVNTDWHDAIGHTGHSRVTFGNAWCRDSILELFEENIKSYPVLLPTLVDRDIEQLWHLLLHNGTIWRWNRPLIGTETGNFHLRIEQRVVPAGPTVIDLIANAAFYFGLTHSLANQGNAPESEISFAVVKKDFYQIARDGLRAIIHWPGEHRVCVRELLLEQLIPQARSGLLSLGINQMDVDKYLGVIRDRVDSNQNGAGWQRQYVKTHQCNMQQLTEQYLNNQQTGEPVHTWPI